MAQPDVSVAIIFKNEIRCLERCLKSIQPLKKLCSCEIVIADTGSDDGSHEIAEKYADVLFDFPWINDFSAARNAVFERCTGRWYMVMDADVWLGDEVEPLARFVRRTDIPRQYNAVSVVAHNYSDKELTHYADFFPIFLLRAEAKPHYVGKIHEKPVFGEGGEPNAYLLRQCEIHHDGYVMLNDGSKAGREKIERNMALLRERIAETPDDMRVLQEYIDSGKGEPDYQVHLRRAVSLIAQKAPGWDGYGMHILRNAINYALSYDLPERADWVALMEELFPQSYLTQLDVNYVLMNHAGQDGDYEESARRGEAYLRGWRRYKDDPNPTKKTSNMMLNTCGETNMHDLCISLANTYIELKKYDRAYARLSDLRWGRLERSQLDNALRVLLRLYVGSDLEFDVLIGEIWNSVEEDASRGEKAKGLKEAFLRNGSAFFDAKRITNGESIIDKGKREFWQIFLPLEGRCILGDAAALLRCETAEAAEEKLAAIEDLTALPNRAFVYAVSLGCRFPPIGRKLNSEEMDALALKLDWEAETLINLAIDSARKLPRADVPEYGQALLWTRALVLVAVRRASWKKEENDCMELARAFVVMERAFLPYCYTPAALDELCALPSMHRYGMFCVRAFDALDAGDYVGCIRALHDGIKHCGDMRPMVDYLLERVQKQAREEQIASAPPELRAMAEQVKALLAKFDPDSPEVKQLKESPAYQKVAYLIED